ncbi:hypothetical protein VDGD_20030 [Verticillium dahliae]|nr:hypothetical protein VDGD_20030 [Verticillium dahliae]
MYFYRIFVPNDIGRLLRRDINRVPRRDNRVPRRDNRPPRRDINRVPRTSCCARSEQTKAVGIVRHGGAPVGEDTQDADVVGEDVQQLKDVAVGLDGVGNGGVVVAALGAVAQDATALERPGDDLEPELVGPGGVGARHDPAAVVEGDEVRQRRRDDPDAVGLVGGQVGDGVGERGGRLAVLVEVDGLRAERGLVVEPVENVRVVERLGPDAARVDAGLPVLVDELLGVGRLRVVAVKGHGDAVDGRVLELGRELQAQLVRHANVLLVRQHGAAAAVELGAPDGRAEQVRLGRRRRRVGPLHARAQRLELGERNVGRAALGRRRPAVLGRREGRRALCVERRVRHYVGRVVEVALRVAAHELAVAREGDVALEHAGAHAGAGEVRLDRVFGHEKGAAACFLVSFCFFGHIVPNAPDIPRWAMLQAEGLNSLMSLHSSSCFFTGLSLMSSTSQ